MPRTFLIDTDTGSDDAVAIIMALRAPDVRVAAITVVAGNVPLPQALSNALYTAELCGSDVPVFAGASHPLKRALCCADWFHGQDGLGDHGYVPKNKKAEAKHAVDAMIETIRANPGLTIVTLGPLTNVALALQRDPKLAESIGRCVIMGGNPCCEGNITPAAEFNIYVDPEAADAVFSAGWDLTMIGLDVTHLALYTPQVGERLAAIDTRAARWMAQLLTFFGESYRTSGRMGAPPIHDAVAVASVIDPSLVKTREARVEIETAGRLTRGMTVVDFNATSDTRPHHVGVDLDVELFWDLVLSAVGALP
jgi:purine nucleosidase